MGNARCIFCVSEFRRLLIVIFFLWCIFLICFITHIFLKETLFIQAVSLQLTNSYMLRGNKNNFVNSAWNALLGTAFAFYKIWASKQFLLKLDIVFYKKLKTYLSRAFKIVVALHSLASKLYNSFHAQLRWCWDSKVKILKQIKHGIE